MDDQRRRPEEEDGIVRSLDRAALAAAGPAAEWLVANGLGGYASATAAGALTRRYHGLLVAALPAPLGRMVMLSHLREAVRLADGRELPLVPLEQPDDAGTGCLDAFALELGLPVWRFAAGGVLLEKRLFMPYRQNAVQAHYRLLPGSAPATLLLRPAVGFRALEAPVAAAPAAYRVGMEDGRCEITGDPALPPLRLRVHGAAARLVVEGTGAMDVLYRQEAERGYDSRGMLWSGAGFEVPLAPDRPAALVAGTEPWPVLDALPPAEALALERERRRHLLSLAPPAARAGPAAELVLAADAFLMSPAGRSADQARAQARGDEVRSVVAGYHWFTDWGRDTMIALEGLTLCTGRAAEARWILRAFAGHVRDGLIPNLFPEGRNEGLYHTADATLWFFHAVHRYVAATGDRATLRRLLPVLLDIAGHHRRGTRFGIGMDPADGLLRQGAEGYQLTWMDAKVEGWVVTPRRGKAVEINALWHNALRLLAGWLAEEGRGAEAEPWAAMADRARASFNDRFWYAEGGHLHDVVDAEGGGDDPACRPNQVLAISLDHPVLDRERWEPVLRAVEERLLTPVGLRSLAPGHPDYRGRYFGDLRSRDAAYHQGTVWGWLIGPYLDARLKLHPEDRAGARRLLEGLAAHLGEAGIGTLSEIFDAEPPYTPRGCIAQAWSVAEALRCWVGTAEGGAA
ncbi:MAG TPA: amylo-alpha-1,6-glucosidase [Azospirillaceae bacterium]|nr:amylo-alpha-1,6-glucosidase [Azospirillaceae bacterium]